MQKLVGKLQKSVNSYSAGEVHGDNLPEKQFLQDLLDIIKLSELFTVMGILSDGVKSNYDADYSVESMTVYGRKVQNPQEFAQLIEEIKETVFIELQKRYLAKAQEYAKKFPEAIESDFLRYLLAKINKDSSAKDYIEVLEQISERLVITREGKLFKSTVVSYQAHDESQHAVANSNQFKVAYEQLKMCANNFRRNLEYTRTFDYKPDQNGAIETQAFTVWEGDAERPSARYVSAVNKAGTTIYDITRTIRIREYTQFSLLAEILTDVFMRWPELKSALGGLAIDKFLKIQSENPEVTHFDAVNELLKKAGERGEDPLKDKILLIEILRKIDAGLDINCDELYQAYARVYDLGAAINQPEANELLAAAKELLLVHTRIYRDITRLRDYKESEGYYFLQPITITGVRDSGEIIKRVFDQRDNKSIIEFVLRYQPKGAVAPQDRLLLQSQTTLDAIARIKDHLSDPDNRITDTPSLLDDLLLVVTRKELMHNSELQLADQVLINQVEQREQKMRSAIEKLQNKGVDVKDLAAAVDHLLHQRAAAVNKNPEKIAIKEELLSIGQTFSGDYYGRELLSSISIGGESVTMIGAGKPDLAITFDEAGAYVRMQIADSQFLVDGEPTAFDAVDGHRYNCATEADRTAKKDALVFKASLYLTAEKTEDQQVVPPVQAKLTELRITSHSPDLVHTAKMADQQEQKETKLHTVFPDIKK